MKIDEAQRRFCESDSRHIRLLAPAGCGKTSALLHRCLYLSACASHKERYLLVTFTKAAQLEAQERLSTNTNFAPIRDIVTVSTLNAYGFRRIRNELQHPRMLSSRNDRHFAMRNQLQPVWRDNERLATAITGRGNYGSHLMTVVDEFKALGFDHTTDINLEKFSVRLDSLQNQGLWSQIEHQVESLTRCRIFDEDENLDLRSGRRGRKLLYDRFFVFWRAAVERLHDESTFTFEDQKYWCWLNLRSPGPDGKEKPPVGGVARYAHVLVDEFQDINPLDLALVKTIVERHRASITIVGDDDQAIFEWRGATPEYILNPHNYFGAGFETVTLETNYRSPQNVVDYSQRLIRHNKRRVAKSIAAVKGACDAKIEVVPTGSIGEQLQLVTKIAKDVREPGRVAVIGRTRSQLIPYEVYYASDGGPVKTAIDLDVFASNAFESLMELLNIWERREDRMRRTRVLNDALYVLNQVRRFPFSKKDEGNVKKHLQAFGGETVVEAVRGISSYAGPALRGKSPVQLATVAGNFVAKQVAAEAIRAIADGFSGLRFDFEKAEDDVWFVAPPLRQLADLAESEAMSAEDLIERLEAAKERLRHDRTFGDGDEDPDGTGRPLHLMTATRAKGKEFETVILLDVNEGIWPHKRTEDLEAERRLFYVAFTRAQRRVLLLPRIDGQLSRFVRESGLISGAVGLSWQSVDGSTLPMS